jgi:hypothetical protein
MTIDELKQDAERIEELSRKAKEALRIALDKEHAKRMEPLKALVKRAHACLCSWNHTDGCGWQYEITKNGDDVWDSFSHHRWLTHYDDIINGGSSKLPAVSIQELEAIIESIELLKPKVNTAMYLFRTGRLAP